MLSPKQFEFLTLHGINILKDRDLLIDDYSRLMGWYQEFTEEFADVINKTRLEYDPDLIFKIKSNIDVIRDAARENKDPILVAQHMHDIIVVNFEEEE